MRKRKTRKRRTKDRKIKKKIKFYEQIYALLQKQNKTKKTEIGIRKYYWKSLG